jgi:hypothetical protein
MLVINSVKACLLGTVSNSKQCQLQNCYAIIKFKQANCHFQTYPSKQIFNRTGDWKTKMKNFWRELRCNMSFECFTFW